MSAYLAFPIFLVAASFAFVAVVAVVGGRRDGPEFFTAAERADHEAAWEQHMSPTPIYDDLAVDFMFADLDEAIRAACEKEES